MGKENTKGWTLERFEEFKLKNGLTDKRVAEICGITKDAVYSWKRRKTFPPTFILLEYAVKKEAERQRFNS